MQKRIWIVLEATRDGVNVNGTIYKADSEIADSNGYWQIRHTPFFGLHVCRFENPRPPANTATLRYTVRLRSGCKYRLGPVYGHRIVTPEEERDPFMKVVRKHRISKHRVAQVNENDPVEYREIRRDLTNTPRGTRRVVVITDGVKESGDDVQYASSFVTGGTFVMQVMYISNGDNTSAIVIEKLVVRPSVNLRYIDDKLTEVLEGITDK